MTQRHHQANAAAARGSRESSDGISYRAITLGMAGVLVLGLLLRLAMPPEASQEAAAVESSAQQIGLDNDGLPEDVGPGQGSALPTPALPAARPAPDSVPQTAGVLEQVRLVRRLNEVLAKAAPRERKTADALKRFAETGLMLELQSLNRDDVVALAEYLSTELSPQEVTGLMRQFLGYSGHDSLTAETAPSTLVDVFDALAGNAAREVRPSVMTVTDGADAEGRIIGQAHVLPAGARRVYAVFENDRALAGLDQVLAIWRNPDDERMVFTEFEPIRRGSAYNYVWLEIENGWPEGRYQVELFDPEAQSLLLASESFSVR